MTVENKGIGKEKESEMKDGKNTKKQKIEI